MQVMILSLMPLTVYLVERCMQVTPVFSFCFNIHVNLREITYYTGKIYKVTVLVRAIQTDRTNKMYIFVYTKS